MGMIYQEPHEIQNKAYPWFCGEQNVETCCSVKMFQIGQLQHYWIAGAVLCGAALSPLRQLVGSLHLTSRGQNKITSETRSLQDSLLLENHIQKTTNQPFYFCCFTRLAFQEKQSQTRSVSAHHSQVSKFGLCHLQFVTKEQRKVFFDNKL